jgi:hypothetical protein
MTQPAGVDNDDSTKAFASTSTARTKESGAEKTAVSNLIETEIRVAYTIPSKTTYGTTTFNPITHQEKLLKEVKKAAPELIIIPRAGSKNPYTDFNELPKKKRNSGSNSTKSKRTSQVPQDASSFFSPSVLPSPSQTSSSATQPS